MTDPAFESGPYAPDELTAVVREARHCDRMPGTLGRWSRKFLRLFATLEQEREARRSEDEDMGYNLRTHD